MSNILGKLKTAKGDNDQAVKSIGQGLAERQKNINSLKEPAAPAPPKPVKDPPINPSARYGDHRGEERISVNPFDRLLGSFKKGTKRVPKTGLYKVHEGEQVLNKDDAEDMRTAKDRGAEVLSGAAKPAAQGSEPDEMHIQKMDDGSFHIKHTSKDVPEAKQFTARNKKHLVRHVRNTFNPPGEAPSYEDGGMVQTSGPAVLHKDEAVIPAKKTPMMKNPDITIGGPSKPKPFVPFAGDPKKDRPTAKQTREEIDAIRNSNIDRDKQQRNDSWDDRPTAPKKYT